MVQRNRRCELNDLWAFPSDEFPVHYDGKTWTEKAGGPQNAFAVAAAAPNDVWVYGGSLAHWDGATWNSV